MSAIASFFLLNTSKLEELHQYAAVTVKKSLFSKKIIDNYWDYLAGNAKALNTFDGPGYIYANLFVFLEQEKGIDLTANEYNAIVESLVEARGSAQFILTNQQRIQLADRLHARNYTKAELQQFNKDFSDEGDEETAGEMFSAIEILHANLNMLQNDNELLLLVVG